MPKDGGSFRRRYGRLQFELHFQGSFDSKRLLAEIKELLSDFLRWKIETD